MTNENLSESGDSEQTPIKIIRVTLGNQSKICCLIERGPQIEP
ncbi:19474_t:CDS:2 [Dentiscutata erythropus]|uniref:19474_t:CDS:1 n=1 Tax=Dentiscutata erythropus TaxID=1348616 RepID=A0A9N9AWF2_9GLOM|nr:19474_t:CDS:2 [Dentiscutata erythropus]